MSTLATLQILSGRHTGAVQTLSSGGVAIGSSLAADIVVTDPSVAPIHAKLSCGRFRFELEAVNGGISLGNRKLVAGEKSTSVYPARFLVGDVEAECCRAHENGTSPAFSDRKVLAAASSIVLLFAASWTLLLGRATHTARSSENSQMSSNQTAVPAITRQKPETMQAAAIALRERLASAGIHSIDVSAQQGVLVAKGVITYATENTWRAVQVWFDGSFGQDVMLQSEVAVSASKVQNAPIGIQAVWAGKRPYLIDDHGDKYFEGSFLKDGWIIEKIEDGRVVLRRNQEVLSLDL